MNKYFKLKLIILFKKSKIENSEIKITIIRILIFYYLSKIKCMSFAVTINMEIYISIPQQTGFSKFYHVMCSVNIESS